MSRPPNALSMSLLAFLLHELVQLGPAGFIQANPATGHAMNVSKILHPHRLYQLRIPHLSKRASCSSSIACHRCELEPFSVNQEQRLGPKGNHFKLPPSRGNSVKEEAAARATLVGPSSSSEAYRNDLYPGTWGLWSFWSYCGSNVFTCSNTVPKHKPSRSLSTTVPANLLSVISFSKISPLRSSKTSQVYHL